MDEKAFKTLEFDKIIQLLADKARSSMGKAKARGLMPMTDPSAVNAALTETEQAVDMLLKAGSLPLGGITDIEPSLKRADFGGMLNIEELYNVGEFIYVCQKTRKYASSVENREYLSIIDPIFEQIADCNALYHAISRSIASKTEVSDEASPTLSNIRRNIKVNSGRIQEALNTVLQSSAYRGMIQDAVITMRGGRYCVPIKQEYRTQFPGVVHDSSGSGATLFIEPMNVVNLNNKIRELHVDEQEEVERILTALTGQVADEHVALSGNLAALIDLDCIFAKAELALAQGAIRPQINDAGRIDIKKGRDPLLDAKSVVPIDISLGDGFTALLVTGPNTGGKTVALKTLGLFTLMASAGLFIPAQSGSAVAVFDNVFADIGDEQSIEQSLSTFSSHMVNIVRILGQMSYNSLVLFDELGAGTDPTEGAALAQAIISHLINRGIRCAITTHYSELKLFALEHEQAENAAVEFDINSLRPTYRLFIGALGKSNAFAISKRLGLSDDIIDAAKELLSQENVRFEDIITDLEISKKSALIEEERAAKYRKEAEELKVKLDRQKERMEQSRDKLLNQARQEARALVTKAKEEADAIIKEMQQLAKEGKADMGSLEAGRRKLSESISKHASKTVIAQPKDRLAPIDRDLKAGDGVFIHSLGQAAVVVSANPQRKEAVVRFGSMETKVKIKDLSFDLAAQDKADSPNIQIQKHIRAQKSMAISPRIDLRGLLVEEALDDLSKYLDDAYLSGLGKIEIVHGKGTGALREAVTKNLKKHPHIKSYRLGEFGEGDSGITIAELK